MSEAYRTDAQGVVGTDAGRTFVANLTEGDWMAYTVMTEEAEYDIYVEVSNRVSGHHPPDCRMVPLLNARSLLGDAQYSVSRRWLSRTHRLRTVQVQLRRHISRVRLGREPPFPWKCAVDDRRYRSYSQLFCD